MTCGIYQIVNKVNGKRYVGSSVDIERRWGEHLRMLRGDRHVNAKLQSSFNLHGESIFCFDIVERCDPDQLVDREQFHIDEKSEYNIAPVAQSTLGYKQTDETKEKLSLARKRQWLDDEYRHVQSKRMSKRSAEFWADPEMRERMVRSISDNKKEGFASGRLSHVHDYHKSDRFKERFCGKNNPNYNSTEYEFSHGSLGDYCGTKMEFCKMSGVHRSDVNRLVSGKAKTAKGWKMKKAPEGA